jgi:predicted membrane-bound mannosyltransferase
MRLGDFRYSIPRHSCEVFVHMANCNICGEKISRWHRAETQPHFKNVHSDYLKWYVHYLNRILIIGLIVVIVILNLDIYLISKYGYATLYPLVLLLAYGVVIRIVLFKNLRRFRLAWDKTHPLQQ